MRIIVDANIVFSALLNSNGKIGDLLLNSEKQFKFIAPNFLRTEIFKHYSKLSKISGMTLDQIRESEFQICHDIHFISEEQIKDSCWKTAFKLVSDIDPKDTSYVAFSKHFRCKLWSGDKELIKGLVKKGFKNIITTEDIYKIRQEFLNGD